MPRISPAKTKKCKQSDKTFTVSHPSPLLSYLFEIFPEKSRSEVKSHLTHRQIAVNSKTTTAFDYPLKAGDTLTFSYIGEKKQNPNHKVKIVYEDDYIIVVDKKPGVLTMSTGKENEQTAYSVMMEHVRRRRKNNRVFIVHRLDRETSGLLIFAKDENIQSKLQHNWNENIIIRRYVAIVEGHLEKEEDRIVSWLTENRKSLKMNSSTTDNGGLQAITRYKVLNYNKNYSIVELNLETGRKNQIRVQLSSIGHPVAGDKKYGAATNPLGRICLHASTISFIHPVTREVMKFETGIPAQFR